MANFFKKALGAALPFGLGGAVAGAFDSQDLPQAPDFMAAARAQGRASNPNVFNPFGSQTVTWNEDGTPTINQAFTPEIQALFDRAGSFDMSGIPQAPINPGQTAQDAIMARLQPQIERQQETQRTRLANQGIMQGSQAYQNALTDQSQIHNDLMTQAALHGIGLDFGARNQAFGEQSYLRNLPFQDYSNLRSFMPNMPYQAPPIFDATRAQGDWTSDLYNAEAAQQGGMMEGLFGLGGTLGAAAIMSDRRMKTDIDQVGILASGIPVVQFRYLDDHDDVIRVGVIAQDVERVMPEAVIEVNGIKSVNYAKLH